MVIIKILIGLFGLGIVVFIHELGHFLAARLCKIGVEAFSIGWGKPVFKKKIGDVEYRLGMFPVGGYCKFKGDADTSVSGYKEVYELLKEGKKPEEGSFHGASPQARMLTCFAGPAFNLLFAFLLLSILGGIGYDVTTLGNRIVLASEILPGSSYPADEAGLKTGDRIIEINGKPINYSHEAQEIIALNPNKDLSVKVERDNFVYNTVITPELDKSTAAGRVGVYFWIDPVIDSVKEGSPAQKAGLLPGDKIIAVNENPVFNTMEIAKAIDANHSSEESSNLKLEYKRNGILGYAEFKKDEIQEGIGISWATVNYKKPNLSVGQALVQGIKDGWRTLVLSVQSFRLLFMGIDLTQAVSGPVRITYMMGDIAALGMEQGFGTAVRSFFEFISLISIALCIMNLLPLPIIDGGMIILFFVELIRKKPAHPKVVSVFQGIGMAFIMGLMVFALFGDILYFIRK